MGTIRTYWDLSLTLGIPFSRWGEQPFIVHPLPFPSGILEDLAPATEKELQVQESRMHPFLLAQCWRQQLDHDTRLTKARIAAWKGSSRARVTRVMNLLQLPAEIQASLRSPPALLEIHSFSERSLRVLVSCENEEIQTSHWQQLVRELKDSGGNRTKLWRFLACLPGYGTGCRLAYLGSLGSQTAISCRFRVLLARRREEVQKVPRPYFLEEDAGDPVHDPGEKVEEQHPPSSVGTKLRPEEVTLFKYRIAELDLFAMDRGGKGLQEWGFPVLAVG